MKAAGQGQSAAGNPATKGKLPTERKKDTKDCVIIRYRGSNDDQLDSAYIG
jgi:hypothetical protein